MESLVVGARAPRAAKAERARSSSVGQKALIAASGVFLWGWCCLHLLGNLTVFSGAEVMDRYGSLLRRGGSVPLWGLRIALLVAFVGHVWLVVGAWRRARQARPIPYAVVRYRAARWTSRSLRVGGIIIGLFVVFHLLHLTLGALHPSFEPGKAYGNLVRGFDSGLVVGVYVVASLALGSHLSHGLLAAPSSLGWLLPARAGRALALVLGVGLAAGFACVPLAIWLGVLK